MAAKNVHCHENKSIIFTVALAITLLSVALYTAHNAYRLEKVLNVLDGGGVIVGKNLASG